MKGYFITLEGPDGSGKSTITKLLTSYLKDAGYDVVTTREPGGTQISEKIRKIILDNDNTKMSYIAEALLYAASRAQHVHEKILPALKDGSIVICERFVHSSLVYQGIGRGLGIEKIKEINDFAIQGLTPDITLFFDVDPERALDRKTQRNKGDRLNKWNKKDTALIWGGENRRVYRWNLNPILVPYIQVSGVRKSSWKILKTFIMALYLEF